MNENIGVRGGRNDRRRLFRIKKRKKDKEIIELEKDVKKKQIQTLIKVVPFSIIGEMIRVFSSNTNKEEDDKKRNNSKKKRIIIKIDDNKLIPITITFGGISDKNSKNTDNIVSINKNNNDIEKPTKTITQNNIFIPETIIDNNNEKSLEKLKSKKILEEYEKQLKDIRYDLRNLIFDYSVLEDEASSLKDSKQANDLLDKLNIVIDKIDELKRKILVYSDLEYDENYIYSLIEDYLREFHDKNAISSFKDSPLYILISEKIDQIDYKKEKLKEKILEKRDALKENEDNFEKYKEKYYDIDRINKQLLSFQNEQDHLLNEIKYKIKNSMSVTERVEIEMDYMTRQSRRLLQLLSFQMFLRGPKSVRNLTAITASYLFFTRQILHPKTTTKKYRVITVKDYSDDISSSIKEIDSATDSLYSVDLQIDKLISDIKANYSIYKDSILEYDELLLNLSKIKSEIHEKEYEMDKLKKEREELLVINDQKVKTIGEYPM